MLTSIIEGKTRKLIGGPTGAGPEDLKTETDHSCCVLRWLKGEGNPTSRHLHRLFLSFLSPSSSSPLLWPCHLLFLLPLKAHEDIEQYLSVSVWAFLSRQWIEALLTQALAAPLRSPQHSVRESAHQQDTKEGSDGTADENGVARAVVWERRTKVKGMRKKRQEKRKDGCLKTWFYVLYLPLNIIFSSNK